jgi:hypothetical protein
MRHLGCDAHHRESHAGPVRPLARAVSRLTAVQPAYRSANAPGYVSPWRPVRGRPGNDHCVGALSSCEVGAIEHGSQLLDE